MSPLIGAVPPPPLHVMSFNIRRRVAFDPRRADSWDRRRALVSSLIRSESPTVLGVQEALPDQADFVAQALGSRYRTLGRGRDADGGGEGCPLFYDTERLELQNVEQLALSKHPSVAGSKSWGGMIPRVAVKAVFLDRSTAQTLVVMNTHFDPFAPLARLRSAELVQQWSVDTPHPTVVMGDLNAKPGSRAARALLIEGSLRDSWSVAEERLTPEWGTFANYRRPRRRGGRIDWIVVSAGVRVLQTGINTAGAARASDHLPVQAVVQLDAGTV